MMTKLKEFWKHLVKGEMREAGVTLIELLIAVAILAVIAVVAVPAVTGALNTSHENVTEQNMATIAEAINRYAADNNGNYPSDLTKLSPTYLSTLPTDGYGDPTSNWVYTAPVSPSTTFTLTDSAGNHKFAWNGSSVTVDGNSTVTNSSN